MMNIARAGRPRSVSPASSGRSSPIPRSHRALEDGLYKTDKGLRRYGALIERSLGSWEATPQGWADYIAFLARLLKEWHHAIQSHPTNVQVLPHSDAVASRLAQCLNSALPSGVHQKALEVYAYIFTTFGTEYLSAHLHEYLPGLSSVLSFASLSVRPGLYALFEDHIVQLSSISLRPALKALILGLLPVIEDDTSEDFERAYAIMQSLHRKFIDETSRGHSTQHGGYFWQCLFLCIVTSPSRRQGALTYMVRELPRLTPLQTAVVEGDPIELTSEAQAVTLPEPGLIVRCFVAGLADVQVLIQRGFLDLLATHLPLASPVLQESVEEQDVDRLVTAAVTVLLRKDVSLNRRLWAWFLGPEYNTEGAEGRSPSPDLQPAQSAGPDASPQLSYFEVHAQAPLMRSLLSMLTKENSLSTDKARSFRICLSLMDRGEIGGSLIPHIFLPALESLHTYSSTAPLDDVAEVLRSARLFFNGVESRLIWSNLTRLLRCSLHGNDVASTHLRVFAWVLGNFNIRDEEMTTIHIPLTALYLLTMLSTPEVKTHDCANLESATRALKTLINSIRAETFSQRRVDTQSHVTSGVTDAQICSAVASYYDEPQQGISPTVVPFSGYTMGHLMLDRAARLTVCALQSGRSDLICLCAPVLITLVSKSSSGDFHGYRDLHQTLLSSTHTTADGSPQTPFRTIASIVALLVPLRSSGWMTTANLRELEPALTTTLWCNLSPSVPKYHVEAVRLLWQLEDLVAPQDALKASLLGFMRVTHSSYPATDSACEEAVRRFMVLWNHTVPAPSTIMKNAAFGSDRRGSAVPNISDAVQTAHRIDILIEPLLLVLELSHQSSATAEVVKNWILGLPSLAQVFEVLLLRLADLRRDDSGIKHDSQGQKRWEHQRVRNIAYILGLLKRLLSLDTQWTWECLSAVEPSVSQDHDGSGTVLLARTCLQLLTYPQNLLGVLGQEVVSLLDLLILGPNASALDDLNLEADLIDRLIIAIDEPGDNLQDPLLKLTVNAVKLRLNNPLGENQPEVNPTSLLDTSRASVAKSRPNGSGLASRSAPAPPPRLLQCIRMGFTSPSTRFHMTQWLSFLTSILPTFVETIFASLIPLVDCLCAELDKVFHELVSLSRQESVQPVIAPDTVVLGLLDALELILAQAHGSLLHDSASETSFKLPAQINSPSGNVAFGVFRADGPPSKTAQANNHLTVILAFHDSIRICLNMWTWSNHVAEEDDYDTDSALTTSYNALRLRNKTRHLLEQMFYVEPLECLEAIMARWCSATVETEAAAALHLLQVMRGSRPKTIMPVVLDVLCSRLNPTALPPARQSSQTLHIAAMDVALFLLTYLEATEDDAMDEVWATCMTFLRDVLANPLPYRQVLPPLLSLVHLLAKKVGNTNFGEQRKMGRELGDNFLRLLAATFTTLPSVTTTSSISSKGMTSSRRQDALTGGTVRSRQATNLIAVLQGAVADFEVILETSERFVTAINSITHNIISPAFRAKPFPNSVSPDTMTLLLEVARKAPGAKSWRKEVSDAFNDPRFLLSPMSIVERGWLPVLKQWCFQDKDRMSELLSRLAPPSSAGLMFGVGASAARLEADRRTQLNIRRICLILLACPEDAWVAQVRDFDEKVEGLSAATSTSSPSSTVKAELFMLCMALVLSFSPSQLSPLWPNVSRILQTALRSLTSPGVTDSPFNNLGLYQACKLLDQLVALAPDEFQMHEWLYIVDTVDAVYKPEDTVVTALSNHIAEVLGSGMEESQELMPSTSIVGWGSGRRRLLLSNDLVLDQGDVKALPRDEFARSVLRPFLSQLSIHAYEGVYSMDPADVAACRSRLLADVLDVSTVVE